jgi:hypothetical protein
MSCNTAASQQNAPINEYSGIRDASAAAPLSAETFVVANDEDNVLRVYRFGEPNVVQAFSLDQFLKSDPDEQRPTSKAPHALTIKFIGLPRTGRTKRQGPSKPASTVCDHGSGPRR